METQGRSIAYSEKTFEMPLENNLRLIDKYSTAVVC